MDSWYSCDAGNNNDSGCSESSETRSELEARIYSIVHHNDFSGTSGNPPSIDPKYGVEFSAGGEVIVYLKDTPSADIVTIDDCPSVELIANSVIPTIVLDDEIENRSKDDGNTDVEFVETSLKKKRKKKKKKKLNNKYSHDKSIDKYIEHVKNSNALEEYKKKSGLYKMEFKSDSSNNCENVALNVAFPSERAMPMSSSDVLKQYSIGKPTEDSLWYRCPKTWTPDMITFYTKIQKSKRNFDCKEEIRKIRGT